MTDFELIGSNVVFSGKGPGHLFPNLTSDLFRTEDQMRQLKRYLENGNQIFIEYTKGARAGSIGRLRIKAEEVSDIYILSRDRRSYRLQKVKWEVEWDGRDNVVTVDLSDGWGAKWPTGAVLRFNCPETVWAYKTQAREEKPPAEIYDHFGVLLEVGQLVLYPNGLKDNKHTRFGYIQSITPSGTITVESVKTRSHHNKEISKLSPTTSPGDIVVLDSNDIKDKVVMAKLMHG